MTSATQPTVWQAVLRSSLLLTLFAAAFTLLMSGAYQLTRAPIAAAIQAEELRLVRALVPPSPPARTIREITLPEAITKALDLDPPAKGYVVFREAEPELVIVPARSRQGYGGDVVVIVAVNKSGELMGARVTQHHETPGLGDYIDPERDRNKTRPWITQFAGIPIAAHPGPWRVKKDGGFVDAHAGATISARAATMAIERGARVASSAFVQLVALANRERGNDDKGNQP